MISSNLAKLSMTWSVVQSLQQPSFSVNTEFHMAVDMEKYISYGSVQAMPSNETGVHKLFVSY